MRLHEPPPHMSVGGAGAHLRRQARIAAQTRQQAERDAARAEQWRTDQISLKLGGVIPRNYNASHQGWRWLEEAVNVLQDGSGVFCEHCDAEVHPAAEICPACGGDISEWWVEEEGA